MPTYKGSFKPQNPDKYRGNVDGIVYRSSWERDVMKWLDHHKDVLEWNSEEFVIKYYYDVDKKYHRYYIDFWVKWNNGSVTLIEVKPKKQTVEPKLPKRKTQRYRTEVTTYITNQAKWEAAREWCADHGLEFIILTEDHLNV